LLAWNSKSSIGIYNTATDKITTLKRYDKRNPKMTISDSRLIKFAFSRRYAAFAFKIQENYDQRPDFGSMAIVVYDLVDQTLYEAHFGGWVVIECIRLLNDHDSLVISTTDFGLQIWDFKHAKKPTKLEITYGDLNTYWDKIFEKVKSSLSFSGNSPTKKYITRFEVAYSAPAPAPFEKGASATKTDN
jgi:hypothetical protein